MINVLNTFAVILLFGGLVILAFIKISNPLQINVRANRFFALFLLLFASFSAEEVLGYAGVTTPNLFIMSLMHGLQGSTPFLFYLSVWHYTNPTFRFKRSNLLHFIVPGLFIILIFIRSFWLKDSFKLQLIIIGLMLLQAMYYSIASFVILRKHQKNILQFASNDKDYNLKWLENIIIQVIIISFLLVIYSLLVHESQLNIFGNIFLLMMAYSMAYNSLKQKEVFPINEADKTEIEFIVEEEVNDNEKKKKLILDQDLSAQKANLEQLMVQESLYLDNELNLVKLAAALKVSPHQLSYLINHGFNENFFSFINKYRVEKAKVLLLDSTENQKMLSIAFESGFNSKTAFNTTFKKLCGLTPSEFKQKHK